jgi:KUP system potassium uptake protein
MLMTTLLMAYYLIVIRIPRIFVFIFIVLYLTIEVAFLVANLTKFTHGGWVSLLIGFMLMLVMYVWYRANMIKNRLTEYGKLDDYIDTLKELSNDLSVPKFATNLIFMSNAYGNNEIESKIIYSILQKQPKRADIYWFIHIEVTDEPYTMDYKVEVLAPDDVIKVTFYLGFRVENRINLYLRKVIEDLVKNNEVNIISRYESLMKKNVVGDFRFVVLERFLSYENQLPIGEQLIMDAYFFIKQYAITEDKWFGLDTSLVTVEHVPLIIRPVGNIKLNRIKDGSRVSPVEPDIHCST